MSAAPEEVGWTPSAAQVACGINYTGPQKGSVMNTLYKKQAKELYKALLECEQTWTRSEATLLEWAEHFKMLHNKLKNKSHNKLVFAWFWLKK